MQVIYFTTSLREPSPEVGCKSALPLLGFSSYFSHHAVAT